MGRLTASHVELFNDSLERCTRTSGFLDRFYELFIASSDEVREKFKRTDFKRQKRVLKVSLYMMMLVTEGEAEGDAHLERIAKLHGRSELGVRPELYDLWLDCLIRAVAEFDPLFNAEIEGAWRSILRPGIEFMRSKY